MTTTRMEAFSDAVIAIIITIMVLEMKAPHGTDWESLQAIVSPFLTYVLSFFYLGIYWNNHHHLLQATDRVNGKILWANMHLLFWLSMVPFVTGWMGENHFEPNPTLLYGIVLLMAGVAYWILVQAILSHVGRDSKLSQAVGKDIKGKLSVLLYAAALPLTFVSQWIAMAIFILVALIWVIPDRRIESRV